jgi:hypothetical protein
MIRRVERETAPLKRLGISRKREILVPLEESRDPELALNYSNGFVTVEISYDALDAYIDANGDVPLPVVTDRENGDRRTYDARHKVRVVYDREAKLREVSSRSRDGLYIRVNFPERGAPAEPAAAQ